MNRREFLNLAAGTVASIAAGPTLASPPRREGPKRSLLLSMLPAKLSLDERFAMAKRVGFEGIEVSPTFDAQEQAALKAASEKAGLPIHSIIFGGWEKPLTDASAKVRDEGTERVRQGLRCAKAVGANNLLLVPGIVTEKVRYAEAYERSQEQIRKLIPLAEELGVVIAVEEVWNKFLMSPLEFARYIDEFKSDHVKAYFDVGNVVEFGWPEDWIRTLGKRINRVHLKDYKRKGRQWVNLGEGDVNWKEVRKAFREVGFENYMTTELGGGDEAYLKDVKERVDKIILAE